jgi:hypothetical protein
MTNQTGKREELGCVNTDKELFREVKGDFYSPSCHMTKDRALGINVGGYVCVKPLTQWFALLYKLEEATYKIQELSALSTKAVELKVKLEEAEANAKRLQGLLTAANAVLDERHSTIAELSQKIAEAVKVLKGRIYDTDKSGDVSIDAALSILRKGEEGV